MDSFQNAAFPKSAVGAGKRNNEGAVIPMTVAVNDKVLFGKFAGQLVKIKGEEVLILKEEEIYAVIEKGE